MANSIGIWPTNNRHASSDQGGEQGVEACGSFDPARVPRLTRDNCIGKQEEVVPAADYDRLLAMYRDLKARAAFHGF